MLLLPFGAVVTSLGAVLLSNLFLIVLVALLCALMLLLAVFKEIGRWRASSRDRGIVMMELPSEWKKMQDDKAPQHACSDPSEQI